MKFPTPKITREGFIQFLRNEPGIPESALPDDSPYIDYALAHARVFVDNGMGLSMYPILFVPTVYNMAVSLLLNNAPDEPGQKYFANMRKTFGLNNMPTAGVMSSAADQGTSGSIAVSDQMKNLSLADLMLIRDPYGRKVAAVLMEMGTLWGYTPGCGC